MTVRLLSIADLEPYVEHSAAHSAESGRDGDGYFGPYSRHDPFPAEAFRERTYDRWTKSLDAPGWRRAWGTFDGATLVGAAYVAGGDLPASLHRVMLGVSVLRGHRRQGHGKALVGAAIAWCRAQPGIDWLDLGVFGTNDAAQALFAELGFETTGTTADRWRVDGHRIDETAMTMSVSTDAS